MMFSKPPMPLAELSKWFCLGSLTMGRKGKHSYRGHHQMILLRLLLMAGRASEQLHALRQLPRKRQQRAVLQVCATVLCQWTVPKGTAR